MATATKNGQEEKITALYACLSDDDPIDKKGKDGDAESSNSIQNHYQTLIAPFLRSKMFPALNKAFCNSPMLERRLSKTVC